MIPSLKELSGAPWKVLPPGVHPAWLAEVRECFAINPHRRDLFNGLMRAAKTLAEANVQYMYLDGSFVTGKPIPGDYDACWDHRGVIHNLLDPVFLDFDNKRANQKAKYKGEFFPFHIDAGTGQAFIDFFQTETFTGQKKGILLIDLKSESFESIKEMQI
ncbi:MAG: hypothetical protein GXP14_15200 [Gammaproteobacteria bacterium]|nr:hypothetical protein [Gammaproteobacteria bacterium]